MNVDQFTEQLKNAGTFGSEKNKERTSGLEKIYTGVPDCLGRYQLCVYANDSVGTNGLPFVVLKNVHEVGIPKTFKSKTGVEEKYTKWIKILPKEAYYYFDKNQDRKVSTLSSGDLELLERAHILWRELYNALDFKNNYRECKNILKYRNYTLITAHCINFWSAKNGDNRTAQRSNFIGLFIITSSKFVEEIKNSVENLNITLGNSDPNWPEKIYNRRTDSREGYLLVNVNKSPNTTGYSISVQHTMCPQPIPISLSEDQIKLLNENPIVSLLGNQACLDAVDAEGHPKIFNRELIKEAIDQMTGILAKHNLNKNGVGVGVSGNNSVVNPTNNPVGQGNVSSEAAANNYTYPQQDPVSTRAFGYSEEVQPSPAPFKSPFEDNTDVNSNININNDNDGDDSGLPF